MCDRETCIAIKMSLKIHPWRITTNLGYTDNKANDDLCKLKLFA